MPRAGALPPWSRLGAVARVSSSAQRLGLGGGSGQMAAPGGWWRVGKPKEGKPSARQLTQVSSGFPVGSEGKESTFYAGNLGSILG